MMRRRGFFLSPLFGNLMTSFDHGAVLAGLEPLAAADNSYTHGMHRALLEELEAISCPTSFGNPRPQIVADATTGQHQNDQWNEVPRAEQHQPGQCADPTSTHIPANQYIKQDVEEGDEGAGQCPFSSSVGRKREGAVREIVTRRPVATPGSSDPLPLRKARRQGAHLDMVALKKTWSGTKSKGGKDKLSNREKFVAAIWSTTAAKGVAVSLNLGIRREAMLLDHDDPRRRMTQNLHRHLSAAGYGKVPYAFVFEMTPESEGGRLHLHGVMDTSALSHGDVKLLGEALKKAASQATGAIGGGRQLDMAPIYDAVGWSDYLLEDATRTARELGIEEVFMMNNPMRTAAKSHFNSLRAEAPQRSKTTVPASMKTSPRSAKKAKIQREGFTLRSGCDKNISSGERDEKLAGGVSSCTRHRPHQSKARQAPRKATSACALRSQPPSANGSRRSGS
jgi:hypothetical protein